MFRQHKQSVRPGQRRKHTGALIAGNRHPMGPIRSLANDCAHVMTAMTPIVDPLRQRRLDGWCVEVNPTEHPFDRRTRELLEAYGCGDWVAGQAKERSAANLSK